MWLKLMELEKNHVNVLAMHFQIVLHLLPQYQPVIVMVVQL